jgi:hypothetical protein
MSVYTAFLVELFTAISATLPEPDRVTSQPEMVPSSEQNRNAAGQPSESTKLPEGAAVVTTVPVGDPVPVPDAGGIVTLNATAPDALLT